MQQRTPPAVAVLGGIPAAAQNVAGPSQHALQPVAAAPLPPLVSIAPSQQERDTKTEVQPSANTKHDLPIETSALHHDAEAVPTGLATAPLQAATNHTDSGEKQTPSQITSSSAEQDWNYGCETDKSSQGETDRTDTTVGADTKGQTLPETTILEYKQSSSVCPVLPGSNQATNSSQEETDAMEPPQVASLAQASQASHLSQPDGLETTRLQALCERQTHSAVADGSENKQTELTEPVHATGDGANKAESGAVQLDPAGERSVQLELGEHPATLRTPGEDTQHILPGNGKSACYAAADEMDGYLPRSLGAPSQGQLSSGQAKEEALKGLAYSSAVQKTIAPLANLPLKTSETPQEPDELQTVTEPMAVHNQHELSSQVLDIRETPNLTTGETNLSMDVHVEQVLQNVPLDGVCLDASGKEILSNLSAGESKVLGDGTETILAVTDGIQSVVTGSTDFILNDGGTDSGLQLSLSPNHQQTNSISVTNTQTCETLEGLAPQLLSTSQIDNEILTQQMQSPVPAADTFSEMEACANAEGIIETQTTEIHTHVLRDLGHVCFLQTDLVSDLSSLPVEILEHEVEEGAWLEVTEPLTDGQVVECSEAQLMHVGDEAHCLEAQTIEVSECTVVTYPSDAILSHGQLHLPDSLEEPQVCESTLGSSVELLTEDLGTDTPSPHMEVAGLNADPEPSTASYVESTTSVLTPTASLIDTPGQEVDELLMENTTEVSHVQQSPGAIDPKLLILKLGETPLLKHPPDLLAGVSKKQSPVSVAQAQAGSPSYDSMSAAGAFAECLSPSTSAAAAAEPDQTHMSVSRPASIPCKLIFTSEEVALTSTDTPSEIVDSTQPLNTAPDSPPRRSELVSGVRQPLVGAWSEVCSAIGAKRVIGATANLKLPVGEQNEMGQGDGPRPLSSTPRRLDIAGESSDGEADLSMESLAESSMVTPTLAQRKVCSIFNPELVAPQQVA